MQRPGQDAVPKDDVPWWMKYAGRGLGTVGGGSMYSQLQFFYLQCFMFKFYVLSFQFFSLV